MENVVEEEAVRIFLEFEKMESAIKGVLIVFLLQAQLHVCHSHTMYAYVKAHGTEIKL